jgi:hypothetical protein
LRTVRKRVYRILICKQSEMSFEEKSLRLHTGSGGFLSQALESDQS